MEGRVHQLQLSVCPALSKGRCLQPARDRLSQDPQRQSLDILKGREWADECVCGDKINRTGTAGTAKAQLETVCSDSQC